MKTAEERNARKEDMETLKKDLSSLNEEELAQVAGGGFPTDRATLKEILLEYLNEQIERGQKLHDPVKIDTANVSSLKHIINNMDCNQITANYFFSSMSNCGVFIAKDAGLKQLAEAYFAST